MGMTTVSMEFGSGPLFPEVVMVRCVFRLTEEKNSTNRKPVPPFQANWLVPRLASMSKQAPNSQPVERGIIQSHCFHSLWWLPGNWQCLLQRTETPIPGEVEWGGKIGKGAKCPQRLSSSCHPIPALWGASVTNRVTALMISLGSLVTASIEHLCQELQTHTASQARIWSTWRTLGGFCASRGQPVLFLARWCCMDMEAWPC